MSTRDPHAGFTLVEAVFCTVIVSVMFVAVMQTVAAARMINYKTAGYARGAMLAEELMAEILQQDYKETTDAPLFGPEWPETGVSRSNWDDVDDYDGWSGSPPQDKDDIAKSGLAGWTRTVAVEWINPTVQSVSMTETDAKRITVTVQHNGMEMGRRVTIRTSVFPQAGP